MLLNHLFCAISFSTPLCFICLELLSIFNLQYFTKMEKYLEIAPRKIKRIFLLRGFTHYAWKQSHTSQTSTQPMISVVLSAENVFCQDTVTSLVMYNQNRKLNSLDLWMYVMWVTVPFLKSNMWSRDWVPARKSFLYCMLQCGAEFQF